MKRQKLSLLKLALGDFAEEISPQFLHTPFTFPVLVPGHHVVPLTATGLQPSP